MQHNLIDSHAHISSEEVIPDIVSILARAAASKISAIVNICTDLSSLANGIELAKNYPWVYNAAATPPHDVEKEGEAVFPIMAAHAREGKLVAVGETGLDYYHYRASADLQKIYLRKYLQLALECELPVVIHCRDAFADFFEVLDQDYKINGRHAPGVLHCFTGTVAEAYQVLERGWFVSLSGIVTFKKSFDLQEVARIVPLEQLLIETDSPYLAPQSKRGKPNEPSYLPEIAEKIAVLKGITTEEVAKHTVQNAKTLFKL